MTVQCTVHCIAYVQKVKNTLQIQIFLIQNTLQKWTITLQKCNFTLQLDNTGILFLRYHMQNRNLHAKFADQWNHTLTYNCMIKSLYDQNPYE